MRNAYKIVVGLVIIVVMAGCAHQPVSGIQASAPGFWYGTLHGLIAPIALVASFFTDVRIFVYPNSGIWYDFGFLVGMAVWIASASRAAKSEGEFKANYLANQMDKLQASLDEKTGEVDSLQKRLDEAEDENFQLKGSLGDKEAEIDSLNEHSLELEERIDRLKESLRARSP